MKKTVIQVVEQHKTTSIECFVGDNLREVLLKHRIEMYGKISQYIHCGGRGLCATCGVYVLSKQIVPNHWHDKLASAFGYPRLSCQIVVEEGMIIKVPDNKIMWGQLLPKRNKS